MKFWTTFRYELAYQSRSYATWFYFVLLLAISFLMTATVFVDEPLAGGYFLNAPYLIAKVSLITFFFLGLLTLAPFAGNAAARDLETRMHPLLYSAPIGKAVYLGGRFLAAFALGALVMIAIPMGALGAAFFPMEDGGVAGPINPAAYISTYFLLILPNTFVAIAFMFAVAVLSRRGVITYLIAVLFCVAVLFSWQFIGEAQKNWELGKLTDPLGLTIMQDLKKMWTPAQKNELMPGMEASAVINRLLWLPLSFAMLGLTYLLFKPAPTDKTSRKKRTTTDIADFDISGTESVNIPVVKQTFDSSSRFLQTFTIARESFMLIAKGWGWLAAICLILFVILTGSWWFSDYYGIAELPTTAKLVEEIENLKTHGVWFIIPLLIIYYSGEFVWRERDARLNEIVGASPTPPWISFTGKFTGLLFALILIQLLLVLAGMIVQVQMEYYNFEISIYLKVLLGIRLVDYILLAALSFAIHVIVNQKYLAHLIIVLFFLSAIFGPEFGIESRLLLYGSDPGWSYSDIRGLDPYLYPWFIFKLYWAAWALLLAVIANLLWPRGTERNMSTRWRQGVRKLTPMTKGIALSSLLVIIIAGGFIHYSTHVLYPKTAFVETLEWKADYEKKYRKYSDKAKPRLVKTKLHAEIFPHKKTVEFKGTYRLVNMTGALIDTIHLTTAPGVENRSITLNRAAKPILVDEEFDYRMYLLEKPLSPGDSLSIDFDVAYNPQGFPNAGMNISLVKNGSYFANFWLPSIGYEDSREILDPDDRKKHGLAADARIIEEVESEGGDRVNIDVVVGTDKGQTAVGPGKLLKTWEENDRSYFHYATQSPVKNKFGLFSADYRLVKDVWKGDSGKAVDITILHHPDHILNLDRIAKGIKASLTHLTREYGNYPHPDIRFVEVPGYPKGLFAYPMNILYREGFALLNPDKDTTIVDIPFATVAHEVSHQYWGSQVSPAPVKGAALITESLAWYSALEIVEEAKGRKEFLGLIEGLQDDYFTPQSRADAPLLTTTQHNLIYRKGPLALFAMRAYIGKDQMRKALLSLFRKNATGSAPLPLPIDLYKELQAVTPDSIQYLLHDLFADNTFWELHTDRVTAKQTPTGSWKVTLEVQARKLTIDTQGNEADVEMNDLIQIGLFGMKEDKVTPLYLQFHRIRSGKQTIEIEMKVKPSSGGIDPNHLLMDLKRWNNVANVVE